MSEKEWAPVRVWSARYAAAARQGHWLEALALRRQMMREKSRVMHAQADRLAAEADALTMEDIVSG
jgi:hypothetical protein